MKKINGAKRVNRHRNGSTNSPDHPPASQTSENDSSSPPPLLRPAQSEASASPDSPAPSPVPAEPAEPLTRAEKRLLLAQIVRLNPLDCIDESGVFRFSLTRRIVPAAAIQDITITETTRTDAQGKPVTRRRLRIHLVNKLRALKLDNELAKEEEAEHAKAMANTSREPARASRARPTHDKTDMRGPQQQTENAESSKSREPTGDQATSTPKKDQASPTIPEATPPQPCGGPSPSGQTVQAPKRSPETARDNVATALCDGPPPSAATRSGSDATSQSAAEAQSIDTR